MFTDSQVLALAPGLQALETEEPVVGCWRCQARPIPIPRAAAWRRVAWRLRDAALSLKRLSRPEPDQVVVVTYAMNPATAGNLRPVMQELKRRGRPAFLVTNPSTRVMLGEQLHRGHVDMMDLCASVTGARRRALRQRARDLAAALRSSLPTGQDGNADLWIENGLAMRAAVATWLDGVQPRAVVLPGDFNAPQKGFVLGARRLAVPTIVLQHGTFSRREFPVHAQNMFCWGERFCAEARQLGAPLDQPVAVGCPRMDPVTEQRKRPRNPAVRTALGGVDGKPLVLVISTAHATPDYPDLYRAFYTNVQRLLESGVCVALRLHPVERDLSWYAKHLPATLVAQLRLVPAEIGLYEAIHHSDVAFHVYSTAALEAILLGCPVLTQRPPRPELNWTDLPEQGGGVWADEHDIVQYARELGHEGAGRRQMLARQEAFLAGAFSNRGHATQAVVDRVLAQATAAQS